MMRRTFLRRSGLPGEAFDKAKYRATPAKPAASTSSSGAAKEAPKTKRVEKEEPNFFAAGSKESDHTKTRADGTKTTKSNMAINSAKTLFHVTTGITLLTFIGSCIVGPLYVRYEYGDEFVDRLEEVNRSKRSAFWKRRNDLVSYQTQRRTAYTDMLGMKSYNVTDAEDDEFE